MRGVQGAALRRQRSREAAQRRGTSGSLVDPGETRTITERITAPGSILFGITLFHIGLVFLIIGFLIIITAMIPGSYVESGGSSDMIGTGSFFVCFGGALTLLNRILTKREEDSLGEYVSSRLARSKSGGRLVRDAESGLTPQIPRRAANADGRKTSLAVPLIASRRSSQLTPTHSFHSSNSGATPNDVHVVVSEGEKTARNGKGTGKLGNNGSTVSTVSASQV
ncbi:uncharacterized protein LOC122392742 [Amphibalanus amphitrite]|uniref:uncharacterized protein LOC122392742 n=1 Tax=Amphibalanus amphitrite TaxID=1232801 RepID=UPI001C91EEFC|nr:uncharacterized protein LOC122392742 [Amphibalanus amphitrite]